MDDINLEFDNKIDGTGRRSDSLPNVAVARAADSPTDDCCGACRWPWDRNTILITILIFVGIGVGLAAYFVVAKHAKGEGIRSQTTVPPPIPTTTVPDTICRNETVAQSMLLQCFNIFALGLLQTDEERCEYLLTTGACLLRKIEDKYHVTCTSEDQIAVLKANYELVRDFLAFDMLERCDILGEGDTAD